MDQHKTSTLWPRPIPVVGDTSSAAERHADPTGWAFPQNTIDSLAEVIAGRRDIRRFRPDPVSDELLTHVLQAGRVAPSVGYSQPWRFIVIRQQATRDRAAALADQARLIQAQALTTDRGNRLLDLKLEGLREAPIGIVVACDRRAEPLGVLGRAMFHDADMWSCACAIENMWLTARALGLGMGWVTLFQPDDLAALVGLPQGVETLGWLCLGWPDERPPEPGLQRLAWSKRLPLENVIMSERWSEADAPPPPDCHLATLGSDASPTQQSTQTCTADFPIPAPIAGPTPEALAAATDSADLLLTPPESLGAFDRALNRVSALTPNVTTGTLVLVGADHPVAAADVSAFQASVTRDVMLASVAGTALGTASALTAGLHTIVIDAGVTGGVPGAQQIQPGPQGNIWHDDALGPADVNRLLAYGYELGSAAAHNGVVALGEVGVGNTTIAAALTCALLGMSADDVVGLGAGSDVGIVEHKRRVVAAALSRTAYRRDQTSSPVDLARIALACLGGPEFAVLAGVSMGAAAAGGVIIVDGLATSVAALIATMIEPGTQGHLIGGQQSREIAHQAVLTKLGLEPLLALRFRAGEGVGACLAASLVLQGLQTRRRTARTTT